MALPLAGIRPKLAAVRGIDLKKEIKKSRVYYHHAWV